MEGCTEVRFMEVSITVFIMGESIRPAWNQVRWDLKALC